MTLTFPKEISFIDILFNCSYRKIIDSGSYDSYKEYEINYDLIEEYMTELLLNNKKLLNDEVILFVYNNEVFNYQITDIITQFKKRYNIKDLGIYDKVAIYKFEEENKNNSKLCKDTIIDFLELIKYLNSKKKENEDNKENKNEYDKNITEETKIYEVVKNLGDTFSKNFIKIFENCDNLTIDKASNIFLYYMQLIFNCVKEEIKGYQTDLEEQSKKAVIDYNEKGHLISKKDFATAIRLFTTLVLFLEKDKEKIKSNRNNLVNYLRASDLWNYDINSIDFNKNLNELKSTNAQVSQIIELYDALGGDIEENFCDDVIRQIEKETPQPVVPSIIKDDDGQFSQKDDGQSEKKDEDDDDDPFAKKSDDGDDDDED